MLRTVVDVGWMAWFFRVIEGDDGSWGCRRGGTDYDSHAALGAAIEHIKIIAADEQPAELFVHHLDGTVYHLGTI